MQPHGSRRVRLSLSIALAFLMATGIYQMSFAQIPIRSVAWDLPVRIPSPEESSSWFPDLAVDSRGNVHVVWSESLVNEDEILESVYYSTWNGRLWSQYVDIVAPGVTIRRASAAIDGRDTFHLLYGGSGEGEEGLRLAYKSAETGEAYSSSNWSRPAYLNDRGQSTVSDIAVDGTTLHILYDDSGEPGGACPGCGDIFYRSSPDLGLTWSAPVPLYSTPEGSGSPKLFVDKNGAAYASWDEGWDRLTGRGAPETGIFVQSQDGGQSWSEPLRVSYPNATNAQLTAAADGNGGVMVLWRTTEETYPGIYYMWSVDGGENWSLPETLPNFRASPYTSPDDAYAMAADSAGHIHLLASGYALADDEDFEGAGAPGLYHFEWDGKNWYPANLLYRGGWTPESPRLVIEGGNELHAAWFLRQSVVEELAPHQMMYAHGQASSPRLEPAPLPAEPTPNPGAVGGIVGDTRSTASPEPEPTATWVNDETRSSARLYTEYDDYLLILISLVPVVALIVVAAVVMRRRST